MFKQYLKIGLVYHIPQSKIEGLEYPELVRLSSLTVAENPLVDDVVKLIDSLAIEVGNVLMEKHQTFVNFTYLVARGSTNLPCEYVFDVFSTDGVVNIIVDPEKHWQLFKVPKEWVSKPDVLRQHFYEALLTLIGVSSDDGTGESTPEDL